MQHAPSSGVANTGRCQGWSQFDGYKGMMFNDFEFVKISAATVLNRSANLQQFSPASFRPRENSSHSHANMEAQTLAETTAERLPVTPQRQAVVLLPNLSATRLGVVVAMALVDTTGPLAGRGQATGFAMLVYRVDDPVDAGIATDGLVLGVDEDDLEVLVGGVLVDPVGVQDTQVGAAAADTLLGGGLEGALVLQVVDTLVGRLACLVACGHHGGHGYALSAKFNEWYQRRALSYLPAADAQQEAQNVRLLLLLKFFNVFEGTHLSQRVLISNWSRRKCAAAVTKAPMTQRELKEPGCRKQSEFLPWRCSAIRKLWWVGSGMFVKS
ncbi:hypothetical protein FH972_021836 [Carpinus fangiana]|uniref:Uncharacterized protein n=1 Tax=Carpinus fangiana TaxID=176857 RepID=A0A5N6KR47_9ROSI|nr:hypothetical protein FH972_021836 [Carpinus fangiana]